MKAVGIILAGGSSRRMQELTRKRAIAALPVAGSYRAIDFSLSNMSNSGIERVAVITQYNSQSLNKHLSSSKWWNFGRKRGGLTVYSPTITPDNNDWYRGTGDSLYQNIQFLKESHEPYVVIASGDGVYKLDFNKALEYHIRKEADVTIVCKDMPKETDFSRFGLVTADEEGRITAFDEKPMVPTSRTISCGIYIMRRRALIDILELFAQEERYDLVKDYIVRYINYKKFYAFKLDTYWNCVNTLRSYYDTNMDFLDQEVAGHFFKGDLEIYTKVDDNPSAKYNSRAEVKNSLVSAGCIINGTVENSLLFRKVYVGDNSVIRNSIILNDVHIGDNTVIENCIVESRGTIPSGKSYRCDPRDIKVIVETHDRFSL